MKQKKEYQICKRCVMDTTDSNLLFNEDGICNQCEQAIQRVNDRTFKGKETERLQIIDEIIVKAKTTKTKYDCIIGLSGGVDSSYLAYYIVNKMGLNPLAVHIDNGWDSELAVKNIENIVSKLNIDLLTYVIDWEEFRELQLAYLKASVIDIEVLSDNPIVVVIGRVAKKHNIKYFFPGMNINTESILPSTWTFQHKQDPINIRAIYRRFGRGVKLKTYPISSIYEYFNLQRRVKSISVLDLIEFKKTDAINILTKELEWKDYGGKHQESFFTKFYQNYILPKKFNVDKRKAHLSSMIVSNQITRQEALNELNKPLYNSDFEENEAVSYFIKKMGLTESEFNKIMNLPIKSHLDYPAVIKYIKFFSKIKGSIIK